MAESPRSALTRVLPWAALALMVVFFLLQVSARTKAERDAAAARKALHDLEGARALAPEVGNFAGGGDPESATRFLELGQGIANKARLEAEGEAERLAEELKTLQARLERADGVRAAHVAALEALRAERASADAMRSEAERIDAEAEPLEAERDAAQGALAATELLRVEAEARVRELESLAAAISTQMDRLLTQAAENRGRIRALTRAAAQSADPTAKAAVRSWLAAAGGGASTAGETAGAGDAYALALGEFWPDASAEMRKTHAHAYARVLTVLAPSDVVSRVTLGWVAGGSHRGVEPSVQRRLFARHLRGAGEHGVLFARAEAADTRALLLERLATNAERWDAKGRAQVVGVLQALLIHPLDRARADAARALGQLAAAEATPALIKALGDGQPGVRAAAAWALTRLKRTAPTVAALKALAKTLLASPAVADLREGLWIGQWVLGQPQNTAWLELPDGQVKRIAARVRARLDG